MNIGSTSRILKYKNSFVIDQWGRPQSRSVVITIFTQCPSVPKLQNQATITAGRDCGLAGWIIDDSCLVLFYPRGWPTVTVSSNHCFCTCRPWSYICPSPLFKTKQISSENNVRYRRDCGSGRVDHWCSSNTFFSHCVCSWKMHSLLAAGTSSTQEDYVFSLLTDGAHWTLVY